MLEWLAVVINTVMIKGLSCIKLSSFLDGYTLRPPSKLVSHLYTYFNEYVEYIVASIIIIYYDSC